MSESNEREVREGNGQSRIHIPVALPPLLLGAPQMASFLWFMACVLMMMGTFIFVNNVLYGLAFLFMFFPGHGALIIAGRKEPHLGSLLEIYTKGAMRLRARRIGGNKKIRIFYPG